MIDTTKVKWELSTSEIYVIEYLNKQGFNGEVKKQYVSKTYIDLEKDNIKHTLELPQGMNYDYKKYIENWYHNNWEMYKKLKEK